MALVALFGCVGMEEEEEAPLEEVYSGGLNPVVFVPGCPLPGMTYETLASSWDPMIAFLRTKGYPDSHLNKWVPAGPPYCPSNFVLAEGLGEYVQQVREATNASRVDIVSSSGGSVATRTYLALGGDHCVRDFAAIVGVDHGSDFALLGGTLQTTFGYPNYEQMKELFPPYACEGQTYFGQSADVQFLINGCLTSTGRSGVADETPNPDVHYLSIRNTLDDQIIPNKSSCLNQRFKNDCADTAVNKSLTILPGLCNFPPLANVCPPHVRPVFDSRVWQMVYDHIVAHPNDGDASGDTCSIAG